MLCAAAQAAEHSLSAGVWATYEYIRQDDTDDETLGAIKDEALILYADGNAAQQEGNWSYSAELRIGPGWIYVEFLTQDGFVDRNGQVGEGDFDAIYISMDFYL